MGNYAFLLFPPLSRIWAAGFLLHMALDCAECLQLGVVLPGSSR